MAGDFVRPCERDETRELDALRIETVSSSINEAWSNDDAADISLRSHQHGPVDRNAQEAFRQRIEGAVFREDCSAVFACRTIGNDTAAAGMNEHFARSGQRVEERIGSEKVVGID